MVGKLFYCILFIFSSLAAIPKTVFAEQKSKTELSILVQSPGIVQLEGDIAVNDRIQLYSHEYHSTENRITDKMLSEMIAETEGAVTLIYNPYAEPLTGAQYMPDFDYHGNEISLTALYAVVSDGISAIRSDLAYLSCWLDTDVVDQHRCSLAGDTACGTAAGVLAMQISYPSAGNELITRLNEVRSYGTLGSNFSTGPSEYYLCGDHISNGVNKYVSEELSGTLTLTDHRTADKTTEETLIELLTTGRPAVIEVCYLLGEVTRTFQGISHWITINGFSLGADGYTFRFSDPITVSYRSIHSELLDTSNANVSYGNSGYIPVRYIGAFSEPLFSIEFD